MSLAPASPDGADSQPCSLLPGPDPCLCFRGFLCPSVPSLLLNLLLLGAGCKENVLTWETLLLTGLASLLRASWQVCASPASPG